MMTMLTLVPSFSVVDAAGYKLIRPDSDSNYVCN